MAPACLRGWQAGCMWCGWYPPQRTVDHSPLRTVDHSPLRAASCWPPVNTGKCVVKHSLKHCSTPGGRPSRNPRGMGFVRETVGAPLRWV
eukprot:COSAG01_NODE_37126_length_508_cov_0.753056_1_plen_89_part_10